MIHRMRGQSCSHYLLTVGGDLGGLPFVVCANAGAVSKDAMSLSYFGADVTIGGWINSSTIILGFMTEETFPGFRVRINWCPQFEIPIFRVVYVQNTYSSAMKP